MWQHVLSRRVTVCSGATFAPSSHLELCVRLVAHEPPGVPHAAKATPEMAAPPGQPSNRMEFSAAMPHATGDVGGDGGGGTARIERTGTG